MEALIFLKYIVDCQKKVTDQVQEDTELVIPVVFLVNSSTGLSDNKE